MVSLTQNDLQEPRPSWEWLRRFLPPGDILGAKPGRTHELSVEEKAALLFEYCVASDKKVSETVHSLFIIAKHYSGNDPDDIAKPAQINGIPPLFEHLTARGKAEYCYLQVIDALSGEARPVTIESLNATKREDPKDPWSSYAGKFVRRVTIYVCLSLVAMLGLWYWGIPGELGLNEEPKWVAFGCLGALIHLLNHALTTTRQQTFELSETRKIWPRLMLGGMFGFVLPWLLTAVGSVIDANNLPAGSAAAFFAGYSVRFSTGLLERLMKALIPETKAKA